MPEPAEPAVPNVYQLRVVLRAISPLIWRRLLIRAGNTVADLHAVLQIAFGWDGTPFGWDGTHLHRFVIHGRDYASGSWQDPREVRLADLRLRVGERFTYEYDFIDGWCHDIRVEAIGAARSGRRYPVLTGGRRSAPPENCGGAWAFLKLRQQKRSPVRLLRLFGELLDADPNQSIDEILGDRYGEFMELCRWELIDHFDRRAANRQLREGTDQARSAR